MHAQGPSVRVSAVTHLFAHTTPSLPIPPALSSLHPLSVCVCVRPSLSEEGNTASLAKAQVVQLALVEVRGAGIPADIPPAHCCLEDGGTVAVMHVSDYIVCITHLHLADTLIQSDLR